MISSVCVTFFTSEDQAGGEAMLESLNGGQIVTYDTHLDQPTRTRTQTLPEHNDTFLENFVSKLKFGLSHGLNRWGEKESILR